MIKFRPGTPPVGSINPFHENCTYAYFTSVYEYDCVNISLTITYISETPHAYYQRKRYVHVSWKYQQQENQSCQCHSMGGSCFPKILRVPWNEWETVCSVVNATAWRAYLSKEYMINAELPFFTRLTPDCPFTRWHLCFILHKIDFDICSAQFIQRCKRIDLRHSDVYIRHFLTSKVDPLDYIKRNKAGPLIIQIQMLFFIRWIWNFSFFKCEIFSSAKYALLPGQGLKISQYHFTSRPKCMSGSRDPGITIVNPTEISVMYGYVTWRMTTEISVMYGIEGVKYW